MKLSFDKPGTVTIDGNRWKIVETVRHNGHVYLNVIRRRKVRTVKVK